MNYNFFYLAFALAVLDWVAVAKAWKGVEYFAKPATMLALLAFVGMNGGFNPAQAGGMVWFSLGLLFSLAGDVFLMLPKEQFIAGLISFLLAHVMYVIGFAPLQPLDTPQIFIAAVIALLVAAAGVTIYRRVAAGLLASGKGGLRMPVMIYTIVISVMLVSASLTLLLPNWAITSALAVTAGAALFFLSDAILAWNKFVAPLRYGRLANMSSYHLGQLLIALGAALHFLNG
jgi:uncharacterized membrane protein YhhN